MTDQLPRIPTIEEAEAEVLAEWEAERQAALRFFANERVKQVAELHRQAEREERNRRKAEGEAAAAEKDARKLWTRLFGRQLARKLDPWAEYVLLPWEGKHVAVQAENLEVVRSAATLAGINIQTGQEHVGVRGIYLTRHVTELAGVDPTPEEIAAVGERKAAAERQEREHRHRSDERERKRHRERQMFGVTVDG
jgi:hypothetical protein